MNSYINQKICLKEFIPVKVICKNNHEKSFDLNIIDDEVYLTLCYTTELHNQKGLIGNKHYTLLLPKYIKRNKKMFEVLGLLQAEMGKQHDGKIVFCNHEYQLVNKVIRWFEDEFNFSKSKWKWYVKNGRRTTSETLVACSLRSPPSIFEHARKYTIYQTR